MSGISLNYDCFFHFGKTARGKTDVDNRAVNGGDLPTASCKAFVICQHRHRATLPLMAAQLSPSRKAVKALAVSWLEISQLFPLASL
jgi:hypothetical protein